MEYLLILDQLHTLLRKSHARLSVRYRGLRLSLKGYEPKSVKLRASVKGPITTSTPGRLQTGKLTKSQLRTISKQSTRATSGDIGQ